ncbi:MAG: hypothetical protein M1818_003607 [Claussenomyces sp. TS43310]|nr:MAG: hypothetical protein M1818_003607 [Claussenomyces sp. TS43310]
METIDLSDSDRQVKHPQAGLLRCSTGDGSDASTYQEDVKYDAKEDCEDWLPPKPFVRRNTRVRTFASQHLRGRRVTADIVDYYPLAWSFGLVVLAIVVPFVLYREVRIRSKMGNLPFYDCTYSASFSFEGTVVARVRVGAGLLNFGAGIDLPFGRMGFGWAKAIDLAWNSIVGRGLQILLVYFSYRMFTDILMYLCESEALDYELFATTAFYPTQWAAFWPSLRAFCHRCNTRVRVFLFWILLSTIYMACFPTLIDAISSYQTVTETLLRLPNGTFADVTDGLVADFSLPSLHGILRTEPAAPPASNRTNWYGWTSMTTPYAVEIYTIYDGMYYIAACTNSTTTTVWNATYNPPSPNIPHGGNNGTITQQFNDSSCSNWYTMAPYISEYYDDDTTFLINSTSFPIAGAAWNNTYMKDQSNYECVSLPLYEWGFSYEFILLTCCINCVWLLVTWIFWFDANLHSQLVRKGRKLGIWRAILDVAECMQHDLGLSHCAYSDNELDEVLRGKEKIRYVAEKVGEWHESSHVGLASGRANDPPLTLNFDQQYGLERRRTSSLNVTQSHQLPV